MSGFLFGLRMIVYKHNNLASKLICQDMPGFKSQNVEYVAFIDRAPHITTLWFSIQEADLAE